MPKIMGIYKILNQVNGKFYIGSSIDIKTRWDKHKKELNYNKHHSKHFQRAWNKYGEENFKFEIIEECEESSLKDREQFWLDTTKCYEESIGYNVSKDTIAPMRGRKHTDETKEKARINSTLNNGFRGKHHSEETKEKMRGERPYLQGENNPKYGKKNTNHYSKLSIKDVENIKQSLVDGVSMKELMKKYNVARNTIDKIKLVETWIDVSPHLNDILLSLKKTRKTNDETIQANKDIDDLLLKGFRNKDIIALGYSETNILRRKHKLNLM